MRSRGVVHVHGARVEGADQELRDGVCHVGGGQVLARLGGVPAVHEVAKLRAVHAQGLLKLRCEGRNVRVLAVHQIADLDVAHVALLGHRLPIALCRHRIVLRDRMSPLVELHLLRLRSIQEPQGGERLLPLNHACPGGLGRVHEGLPPVGHPRDANLGPHEAGLPVLGLHAKELLLAVLLEAHELRVGHLVNALHGAALDGLVDELLVVPTLLEDARPPVVVLEHEGVGRHEAAVRAPDARDLVHKDKLLRELPLAAHELGGREELLQEALGGRHARVDGLVAREDLLDLLAPGLQAQELLLVCVVLVVRGRRGLQGISDVQARCAGAGGDRRFGQSHHGREPKGAAHRASHSR
mmetsp:Transcript_20923/g.70240  ORF Transcript_20923/g.70240 Transcript_20923/m.70240 type:complete len:355 (+) Transcript_20923:447-1511(+)